MKRNVSRQNNNNISNYSKYLKRLNILEAKFVPPPEFHHALQGRHLEENKITNNKTQRMALMFSVVVLPALSFK